MPLPFPCLVLVEEHQHHCLDVVLAGGWHPVLWGWHHCIPTSLPRNLFPRGTLVAAHPPSPDAPCSSIPAAGFGMPLSHPTAGIWGCSPVPSGFCRLEAGRARCRAAACQQMAIPSCSTAQQLGGTRGTFALYHSPPSPCSPAARRHPAGLSSAPSLSAFRGSCCSSVWSWDWFSCLLFILTSSLFSY